MRIFLVGLISFLMITPGFAGSGEPGPGSDLRSQYMRLHSVEGQFAIVREDLELAITSRGMVINNVSHIGNMLERTRKDVGGKKLFVQAEALEFCSSVISRNMMDADPHNIVFCPYIIAVYVLPEEEDKVYVAYRRPLPLGNESSQKALLEVEKLLADIVAEVVE